jgi:hypothetical protein
MCIVVLLICVAKMCFSGDEFKWRTEENRAYTEHEHLGFSVKWQFVTVGSAVMDVRGVENVRGRECYHIVTEAITAPFFDAFYKVRDQNESFIDKQSLCPLRFISRQCEGSFCKQETIEFFQESGGYRVAESTKTGTITLYVQDVLSGLYYMRTRDLEVGKIYSIDAQSGDKAWPLSVTIIGLNEVTVPAGTFHCVVVEPKIREGAGIFQAKGKLTVWLTDDERHMPVLMRSKIAIGAIEAELIEFKN